MTYNCTPVVVCIPAYNAASTIRYTLDSLVQQTYQNLKIIVVDNCSIDNTAKIVEEYQQRYPNIQCIRSDTHIPAVANYEKCLHIGEGKYRAIFHADDIYEPTIIAEEVRFLDENSGCGAVSTRADFINDRNEKISESQSFRKLQLKNQPWHIFNALSLIRKLISSGEFIMTPSIMLRADVATDIIGQWNKEFSIAADVDMWLRIAEQGGGLGLLNKKLMKYRKSLAQGTTAYNKSRTMPSDFLRILEYWVNKPDIKQQFDVRDRENYVDRIKFDRILCSARAFLQEKEQLGKELFKNTFSISYFRLNKMRYAIFWALLFLIRYKIFKDLNLNLVKKILSKRYLYN